MIYNTLRHKAKGYLVRFVRRWQSVYYERADRHLDLYDEMKGDDVADLYHRIMHYVYVALYWFCVCNVKYKKGD